MDVFGLEPIQATILVSIVGVGLQILLGYLKSGNQFDPRQLLTSAIIAIVLSFTIVANAISNIPEGADNLAVFLTLVGVIGTIAGIDILLKNGAGVIKTRALQSKKR